MESMFRTGVLRRVQRRHARGLVGHAHQGASSPWNPVDILFSCCFSSIFIDLHQISYPIDVPWLHPFSEASISWRRFQLCAGLFQHLGAPGQVPARLRPEATKASLSLRLTLSTENGRVRRSRGVWQPWGSRCEAVASGPLLAAVT